MIFRLVVFQDWLLYDFQDYSITKEELLQSTDKKNAAQKVVISKFIII